MPLASPKPLSTSTGTSARIEGASIDEIAQETLSRHSKAFDVQVDPSRDLERGGEFHGAEGEKPHEPRSHRPATTLGTRWLDGYLPPL